MQRFLSAVADMVPGALDVAGVVWPWVKWGCLSCVVAIGLFVELGRRRQWDGRLASAHAWASAFIDEFEADSKRSLRTLGLLLASVLIVIVGLWAFRRSPIATTLCGATVLGATIALALRRRRG